MITNNNLETIELGKKLGLSAKRGDLIWLHGDLGAGKTEMTKGIAVALNAEDPVSSPSFALIHEYHGPVMPLYHIDLYRLYDDAAMDLGISDYIEGNGLTVIEWGERLPEDYYDDGVDLYINHIENDFDKREITLKPRGKKGEEHLNRFWELNK